MRKIGHKFENVWSKFKKLLDSLNKNWLLKTIEKDNRVFLNPTNTFKGIKVRPQINHPKLLT